MVNLSTDKASVPSKITLSIKLSNVDCEIFERTLCAKPFQRREQPIFSTPICGTKARHIFAPKVANDNENATTEYTDQ